MAPRAVGRWTTHPTLPSLPLRASRGGPTSMDQPRDSSVSPHHPHPPYRIKHIPICNRCLQVPAAHLPGVPPRNGAQHRVRAMDSARGAATIEQRTTSDPVQRLPSSCPSGSRSGMSARYSVQRDTPYRFCRSQARPTTADAGPWPRAAPVLLTPIAIHTICCNTMHQRAADRGTRAPVVVDLAHRLSQSTTYPRY